MDMKQQPQVPQLQLAKVGERKRRKGGALPLLGGGSGAAGHGGGVWGSVSGILSQSALKIGITLLAGAVGVGAYQSGKTMRPDSKQFERKPQTLFASKNEKPKYSAADTANLPGASSRLQSSVGMVFGSRDGMSPEEREAQAKAEAEKAKKAAEEQAKADAAAAKEPGNVPGAGMPDPAALAAAAAEKEKAAAFSRKFGELSKGGGSTLAGGAGMGGGIGQGFQQLPKNKGTSGVLSTLGSNRAGGTSSARISAGKNPGRSLAQRQLNRAVQSARQMSAGANETRAAAGGIPFDTAQGNSQLLSGTGGGAGAGPATSKPDSNPSSGGGGGGNPVGVSSSGETGEDDCNLNAAQFGWGGEWENSPSGGCVKKQNVEGTGEEDPTNKYYKWLELMSMLATIVSGLIVVCAICAKTWPTTAAFFYEVQILLAKVLIALGAFMTILSLMLYGMGRDDGKIFALLGGLTMLGGYLSMTAGENAAKEKLVADELTKEAVKQMTITMVSAGATSIADGYAWHAAGDPDQRTWNSDTNQWE